MPPLGFGGVVAKDFGKTPMTSLHSCRPVIKSEDSSLGLLRGVDSDLLRRDDLTSLHPHFDYTYGALHGEGVYGAGFEAV